METVLDQELWAYYQQYGMPPNGDHVEERCTITHEDQRCALREEHDGPHVMGRDPHEIPRDHPFRFNGVDT